jgi:hypothetical protein
MKSGVYFIKLVAMALKEPSIQQDLRLSCLKQMA